MDEYRMETSSGIPGPEGIPGSSDELELDELCEFELELEELLLGLLPPPPPPMAIGEA